MTGQTIVESGQLWVDNDPRSSRRRFIRVTSIDGIYATCEAWYDEAGSTARTTRIRIDRFKTTATGYRRATTVEQRQQEA